MNHLENENRGQAAMAKFQAGLLFFIFFASPAVFPDIPLISIEKEKNHRRRPHTMIRRAEK